MNWRAQCNHLAPCFTAERPREDVDEGLVMSGVVQTGVGRGTRIPDGSVLFHCYRGRWGENMGRL